MLLCLAATINETTRRSAPNEGSSMSRAAKRLVLLLTILASPTYAADAPTATGHYLFAWAGDVSGKGNDFLAVIDADPESTAYGHLIATGATDQVSMQVHHTEYAMPEAGLLFANDHLAGRTFIFDVRDPLHPRVATSFTDMAGYAHPHSFLRLPNGHVLASFQHMQHAGGDAQMGNSGGLVEIDDQGHVIRSASSADPAFPDALLMPYSLIPLPKIDRVVVTNSSMHDQDPRGHTFQVWRLSDLKLLKTVYFDTGGRRYGEIDPEEPRLGPDGSVYVQTLACGIERITDIATANPKSQLIHVFPGALCGVPTIVGHYLIQSDRVTHGLIVLDISKPAHPVEVSRLTIEDVFLPHWTGWDSRTQRLVVTGYGTDHRLFMLQLDQSTGALTMDTAFHGADGRPGFSFDNREWPHGWTGSANPHGVVFSR
jgi:56kDa selenium binding protein (SBP56)